MAEEGKLVDIAKAGSWTMRDVQKHLQSILHADLPLTREQRTAIIGVIEMCAVWNKLSPGFAKVVQEEMAKHGTSVPAPLLRK